MKLNEPEKQILDDFEHKVTSKIALYGDRTDFPKIEDYGINRQDLDGYLFDKQCILDFGGSKRTQYTVLGFCVILPILALSCVPESNYPWGNLTVLAAIGVGLIIALFVNALRKMYINVKVKQHEDVKYEKYINAVLFYQPR